MITGPVTNRERVEGSLDHPQFPMLELRTVEKASTGARWDRGCAVVLSSAERLSGEVKDKGQVLRKPEQSAKRGGQPHQDDRHNNLHDLLAGEEHDLGHDVGASDNSGSEHLAGICQERHHR